MNLLEIDCDIPDDETIILRIGLALCKCANGKHHHKLYMPYEREIVDTVEDLDFMNRFQGYLEKSMRKFEKLEKQRRAKRRAE